VVPDLATTLPTPTDGGRTYTFQLRAGIRYSNGNAVRPEDFRRELERVFRLGNGYPQSFYTGILGGQACIARPARCTLAGGVVPDDAADTVTFHLTAPDPDFLYKLAFPWAVAVPATTPLRSLGRSMPPATGPYETKSITPSSQLSSRFGHALAFATWTLVRNPRFHEWSQAAQPSGYPDRIVLRQGQDLQQAVDAVERRRLDLLLPAPADRLAELATRYTGQFHSEPVGITFAPVMNTRLAPFNRVLVRRALNYGVDRREVVSLAGGPLAAQPTCQILPPDLSGYKPYCPYTSDPSPSGSWQGPDIAKASQLIDASGTRGMHVTLVAPSPDFTNHTTAIGHYLVSLLDRLGYRASLRITPVQQYWPDLGDSRSRIQLGWFSWEQDYPGPADFFSLLLSCRAFLPGNPSNTNNSEFCSPSIDAEMQRASALEASDPGAASQAWSTIDRQITDQAPWLPLYNPRLNILTSPRVGNYQYHPFFGLLLDQLWVR
jgi:peptide/nickel transport system substrate-binding protein